MRLMLCRSLLTVGFLALTALHACWATTPLRFGALNAWAMPYGQVEGDKLVGGILFDLSRELEPLLDMPVISVVLPRKRIDEAALDGSIDLRCYMTPQWTDTPDAFVWSGSAVPEPKELAAIPAGTPATAPRRVWR